MILLGLVAAAVIAVATVTYIIVGGSDEDSAVRGVESLGANARYTVSNDPLGSQRETTATELDERAPFPLYVPSTDQFVANAADLILPLSDNPDATKTTQFVVLYRPVEWEGGLTYIQTGGGPSQINEAAETVEIGDVEGRYFEPGGRQAVLLWNRCEMEFQLQAAPLTVAARDELVRIAETAAGDCR